MYKTFTRILLVATTFLIGLCTADFHLMYRQGDYVATSYLTCPSNYFQDACWCNHDRSSDDGYIQDPDGNGQYKLTLDNVCGVAAIDFWYRPSGTSADDRIRWEAYIPNADGHVVATCYPNGAASVGDCNIYSPAKYTVYDAYVCYGGIC